MVATCYMCGNPVTSKEHVPPKCFFPEKKDLREGLDFRKNLIKVPSCDEHNSHKSLDDEYLMFVLASALQGNSHKQNHVETKIIRAFERRPHVFSSFLADSHPVYLTDSSGKVEESACFQIDLKRFDRALHYMACGIFYHHYEKKWLGGFRVFTNALMDIKSKNAPEVNEINQSVYQEMVQFFSSETAIGENKEIFQYKLISDSNNRHAIHMVLYEGIEITVLLRNELS